jgi:hypothetical protein
VKTAYSETEASHPCRSEWKARAASTRLAVSEGDGYQYSLGDVIEDGWRGRLADAWRLEGVQG